MREIEAVTFQSLTEGPGWGLGILTQKCVTLVNII